MLTRRAEWDGTFSLLFDGEVILERRSLAEVQEKEAFLQGYLALPRAEKPVDSNP